MATADTLTPSTLAAWREKHHSGDFARTVDTAAAELEAAELRARSAERWPPRRGGADPIGDDQAERSGFGGLDECAAAEGGQHRAPTSTYSPTTWQRFVRWVVANT